MLYSSLEKFLFAEHDGRYEARTAHELPVLVRYVPKELLLTAGISIPDATVLDLILYSREQIAEEYKSMGRQNTESLIPNAEWSIISIKPQTETFETPMQPITMCPPPPHLPPPHYHSHAAPLSNCFLILLNSDGFSFFSGCATALEWRRVAVVFLSPEKSMHRAWRSGAPTFQLFDAKH